MLQVDKVCMRDEQMSALHERHPFHPGFLLKSAVLRGTLRPSWRED